VLVHPGGAVGAVVEKTLQVEIRRRQDFFKKEGVVQIKYCSNYYFSDCLSHHDREKDLTERSTHV
jgi:hypothetical protein